MPTAAGFQAQAGRIPGERIATETVTSDSATFTTIEMVVVTVVAEVVEGRTYGVTFYGAFDTTVDGDEIRVQIREDSILGAAVEERRSHLHALGGTAGQLCPRYGEYTADATESKTFVVTGERTAGTGDLNLAAGATFRAVLYVDYIEG